MRCLRPVLDQWCMITLRVVLQFSEPQPVKQLGNGSNENISNRWRGFSWFSSHR